MSEKRELKIIPANYEAAYAMADENTRKILAVLVGDNEKTATPSRPAPTLSDYTTIRSYEDACVALGESLDIEKLVVADVPAHIIAQMKLEHICKALWGGENKCQPTANGSEVWWAPVMTLFTPDEIEYGMGDKQRRTLLSANASYGAVAGFGSMGATYLGSWSNGSFRLCLDTEKKAEYFGKQFVELWAEAFAYNFTVGDHLE